MRITHAKGPGYFTSSTLENRTRTVQEYQMALAQSLLKKSPK